MLNFLRHCLGGSCAVFILLLLSQAVGATEVLTPESNSETELANKITIPQEVTLISSELSLSQGVETTAIATEKTGNFFQQNNLQAQVPSMSQVATTDTFSSDNSHSIIQQEQENAASSETMAQVKLIDR